ncbi:MAG TPA: glycoside hydrolase family 3 C-terminal domain-containing protein, partial [Flavobacteriales bacterium]|nr:glycoside hydrolase family 3 C-terminal domain-containing protein [Flavobacteriales bacterium]
LPLAETTKKILVIGPDAVETRLGGYSGPGNSPVSILDGLRERLSRSAQVSYVESCGRRDKRIETFPTLWLYHSDGQTLHPGLRGTYYNGIDLNATPAFTRNDANIEFQWTLFGPDPRVAFDHFAVKWDGVIVPEINGTFRIGMEGNDGYRFYLNDQLLIDRWEGQGYHTTLVPFSFSEWERVKLRVEYRERSGNARIRLVVDEAMCPWITPCSNDAALKAANTRDQVIVVAGIEEGEFRDRSSLKLPGEQEELIKRMAATGKPVTVVLIGGSAITMDSWIDDVDAVLMAWYPGEAGGLAIADLLIGTRNPSGKLPITFPRNEGQLPLVFNHYPTGRGDDYVDGTGQPLFPFGYGLSYTRFDYSNLKLSRASFTAKDSVVLSFKLTNSGSVAGEEVVQLYAHDELASIARPVKELKGFQRVALAAGESKTITFTLHASMFSFPNAEMKEVAEPGMFRLMVGSSSKDIRLRAMIEYVE